FVERFVVKVEPTGEKLHHPGLDRIRELAGDDHKGPFRPHGGNVSENGTLALARCGQGCPGDTSPTFASCVLLCRPRSPSPLPELRRLPRNRARACRALSACAPTR